MMMMMMMMKKKKKRQWGIKGTYGVESGHEVRQGKSELIFYQLRDSEVRVDKGGSCLQRVRQRMMTHKVKTKKRL